MLLINEFEICKVGSSWFASVLPELSGSGLRDSWMWLVRLSAGCAWIFSSTFVLSPYLPRKSHSGGVRAKGNCRFGSFLWSSRWRLNEYVSFVWYLHLALSHLNLLSLLWAVISLIFRRYFPDVALWQVPHLNGFSFKCTALWWRRRSCETLPEYLHWPHL